MFTQGQRLLIRDARQVARIGRGRGPHQFLYKHNIGSAGAHIRESIAHLSISVPRRHTLRNQRIYAVIDLLPDLFKLTRRAQVSLYCGIAHLTMYPTRDKALEPLSHGYSFPSPAFSTTSPATPRVIKPYPLFDKRADG